MQRKHSYLKPSRIKSRYRKARCTMLRQIKPKQIKARDSRYWRHKPL